MHIFDAFDAEDVADLMRIGDDGCCSLGDDGLGKVARRQHRGLNVHVGINEAGNQVHAVAVDLLLDGDVDDAGILIFDMGDEAVVDIDVAGQHFAGEDVDDAGVSEDSVAFNFAESCPEQCTCIFRKQFEHGFLSPLCVTLQNREPAGCREYTLRDEFPLHVRCIP